MAGSVLEIDGSHYEQLLGFLPSTTQKANGQAEPPPRSAEIPNQQRRRFILVGAGISGIQQAILLIKNGIQLQDMKIFDAQDSFGGVWRRNVYPGCACDVPAVMYSTSWHLNPDWTHRYAEQRQIQSYYDDMARSYGLHHITSFESYVASCVWDEDQFLWVITVHFKTGTGTVEVQTWTADAVIQSVGQLDRPKFGGFPDMEKFRGKVIHTNLWPPDVDLWGKQVAVVGIGSSAAQVIPSIVDQVDHLTVFIRTPPTVMPRIDPPLTSFLRWAFRWVPGYQWLIRMHQCLKWARGSRGSAVANSPSNKGAGRAAVRHLESAIEDKRLRRLLMPESTFFCKRPLVTSALYPALAKPNCTVVRETLVKFTECGLLTRASPGDEISREFDVVVLGTGFNTAKYLEHEYVVGRDGIELRKQWEEHPEALYGLGISNMPNFFMCFGPNSSAPWLQHQDIAHWQGRYVAQIARRIYRRRANESKLAFYPRPNREHEYNRELQEAQVDKLAWGLRTCSTYYKNDQGWITFSMPWTLMQFWWMTRWVKWEEWVMLERKTDTAWLGRNCIS